MRDCISQRIAMLKNNPQLNIVDDVHNILEDEEEK